MKNDTTLLREEGNSLFQKGHFREAIDKYSTALEQLAIDEGEDRAKCFNNRAQCYLKLDKYDEAAADAEQALTIKPGDAKALFRRCQALEKLGKPDEAYVDAKKLLQLEPKNGAFQDLLRRLTAALRKKADEIDSTEQRITQMKQLAFDPTQSREKQTQALNNFIVLAREEAGARMMVTAGIVDSLRAVLKGSDTELIILAIRVLSTLAKNNRLRSEAILARMPIAEHFTLLGHASEEVSTAENSLIKHMIMSISDLENRKKVKKPINKQFDFSYEDKQFIDEFFTKLIYLLLDPACSTHGRDAAIEIIIKFCDRAVGLGWTLKFIAMGVSKLLRIASSVPEYPTVLCSAQSRMHAACALAAVYDDTYSDSETDEYRTVCRKYLQELAEKNTVEGNVQAIACLATLLQGPFDVGNAILGTESYIKIMLDMASSGDPVQERVAVEAVVLSSSKKDKAMGILHQGVDVLKKLYMSRNDEIKVRALVGLCKLASSKGSDSTTKTMTEGSALKLEAACRKFLCHPKKDLPLKEWAVEAMAYLSLDAEVKHQLCQDTEAVNGLFHVALDGSRNAQYSVACVLMNLVNAYEQKRPEPEMVELAKFAKQHVPESHDYDKEPYVSERCSKLMQSGVANALVKLAKNGSHNCREVVGRVYLALAEDKAHRGTLVASGGGKALIPLAIDNTDVGKSVSAQALAKIAITNDPQLAFPGQRCLEVVRPLMQLLHPDRPALMNFEALMALTNIAQTSPSARQRILKEPQGFASIEHYLFEEHDDLRRAATQCICNLALDDQTLELHAKQGNDRVKLLVLYCGEDDLELAVAASGALAQMAHDKRIATKITEVTAWTDILKGIACSAHAPLQHRALCIINTMVNMEREFAVLVAESELLEALVAIAKLDEGCTDHDTVRTRQLAADAVKVMLQHELIKPTVAAFESAHA